MPAKPRAAWRCSTVGCRNRSASPPRRASGRASAGGCPAAASRSAAAGTGASRHAAALRGGAWAGGVATGSITAAEGSRGAPLRSTVVVHAEAAEPLVALLEQLFDGTLEEEAQLALDGVAHSPRRLRGVGVGAARRLGDHLVDHAELVQVRGRDLH